MSEIVSAFNQSDDVSDLFAALVDAFGELRNIQTDSEADTGTYKYRYMSLGSITAAIREPLSKVGLAVIQAPGMEFGPNGNRVSVTTRLLHKSGQWIEGTVTLGIAANAGAQAVGSGITYARRYGLTALLAIASGDDDDGAQAHRAAPSAQSGPPMVHVAGLKHAIAERIGTDAAKAWWEHAQPGDGPWPEPEADTLRDQAEAWNAAQTHTEAAPEANGRKFTDPPTAKPTDAALRKLHAALHDLGVKDDERHDWATLELGRQENPVASFKDLTRGEVATLTDKASALNALQVTP